MNDRLTYGSVNAAILARVPSESRRILDVGCGTGLLGQALKGQQAQRQVVGITHSNEEAEQARKCLDQVLVEDLETCDFKGIGSFDCVICSHVLEHLRNPDQVLSRLQDVLTPGATLLIALPNVLYWRQRLQFLAGRFRYTQGGLMDSTHLVFFDWTTARHLVSKAGLRLLSSSAEGGIPGSRFLGAAGPVLDAIGLRLAPGLLATQFVLVASPS